MKCEKAIFKSKNTYIQCKVRKNNFDLKKFFTLPDVRTPIAKRLLLSDCKNCIPVGEMAKLIGDQALIHLESYKCV